MSKKKFKIQFGPEDKQKEVTESVKGLFDPNQKSPDSVEDYEFTFIDLKPVGDWSQPGFIIEWGVKKVGFGQLTFYSRDVFNEMGSKPQIYFNYHGHVTWRTQEPG